MSCSNTSSTAVLAQNTYVLPGAYQLESYLPSLLNKNVALVVNQTSVVNNTHLLDTLLSSGVHVKLVFSPEHGFRGKADAGLHINDQLDQKSGIPIISLYGANKKPSYDQLQDIDIVVFDIQDVGVRFYTYISTLHYVMQACTDHNVEMMVLDRPNPNGHYVDGPVLDLSLKSFVGMHPVPIVYGLTIGEYANMILGEKWLDSNKRLDLKVVKCENYTHQTPYDLAIKPSPNLPNYTAILLYPSLCFFEGTSISVGRGTDKQFQVVGHPSLSDYDFQFTPIAREGALHPLHENQVCYGKDYSKLNFEKLISYKKININPLLEIYQEMRKKNQVFFLENNFFDKLAGTKELKKQIQDGRSVSEIRESWQSDLTNYNTVRSRYFLYN